MPWTNVYGAGRSVLALGTLVTLLLHDGPSLFMPLGTSVASQAPDDFLVRWSCFSLVGDEGVEVARWACVAVLSVVVIGWRPRWTALAHWWVAWSFAASSIVANGGEQVAAVLTLLLLPVALTDSRKWHWDPPPTPAADMPVYWHIQYVVAMSSVVLVRLQVAIIYFEAAVSKLAVEEWSNGTAVYYWFTSAGFGMPDWLAPLAYPVLASPLGVTAATWGVVALEATLFLGLTMARSWGVMLLPVGVSFHLAIVLVHGLGVFFLSMLGALILYLWPWDVSLRCPRRYGPSRTRSA